MANLKPVTDPGVLERLNSNANVANQPPPTSTQKFNPFLPPDINKDIAYAKKLREEGIPGAVQSYINTPEQIANVFGGHMYKPFSFAPKTETAEQGGVVGDIASFFMPGNALNLLGKGASFIPKINALLQSGKAGLEARPIVNFIRKLGQSAGEAALFQKAKSPESKATDVAQAGGIGATINALAQAMGSTNPLIQSLSKLLLGSGLGYMHGGVAGIPIGASAAFMAPSMLKEAGYTKKPVSAEVLTRPPNIEALERYEAGKRLGRVPTPAEAFEHGPMGARQGELFRTEEGAEEMTRFGKENLIKEQNAINNLLNKIYPKTKQSAAEINALYKKSYQHSLPDNDMNLLSQDPVFSQASKKVFEDPVYQKDLANVRANSYAYLDQVKRALNDMHDNALSNTGKETNKSRVYAKTAKELTDMMDKRNPVYKQARLAAQREIIRDNIEYRLGKKALTGTNFFKEFLSNDNKFNEILNDLKNNPEAQQILKDMKLYWGNLIGYDTAKAAAGRAATHVGTAREGFQKFWNMYKDAIGSPRDIEKARFIHDPNWWDKFDEVIKYNNLRKRAEALSELIGRGLTAGTLEYSKETAPRKGK